MESNALRKINEFLFLYEKLIEIETIQKEETYNSYVNLQDHLRRVREELLGYDDVISQGLTGRLSTETSMTTFGDKLKLLFPKYRINENDPLTIREGFLFKGPDTSLEYESATLIPQKVIDIYHGQFNRKVSTKQDFSKIGEGTLAYVVKGGFAKFMGNSGGFVVVENGGEVESSIGKIFEIKKGGKLTQRGNKPTIILQPGGILNLQRCGAHIYCAGSGAEVYKEGVKQNVDVGYQRIFF